MRSATSWLSTHVLHDRGSRVLVFMPLAAALQMGAAAGMAFLAGFSAIRQVAGQFSWPWILAVIPALSLSYLGYLAAYHGIHAFESDEHLTKRELLAVTAVGFSGLFGHGSALDDHVLQASGKEPRESAVRVSALTGLEWGVIAVIGTVAAIVVLVRDLPKPTPDFSVPWAVIPIPGFVLAFWLAEHYRYRFRHHSGWRGKLGIFLDSIHHNRELFLRPHHHGPGALGMGLFWLADAVAMWVSLAAFGYQMNFAAMFIGYATGMLFSRRSGPLAGAGILMVVLPLTVSYSGAPLATAVVGVFAYRVLTLWLPMPFGLAAVRTLRRLGERRPRSATSAVTTA